METIASNLGMILERPVIITDQYFHIMAVYQDRIDFDPEEFWQSAIQDQILREILFFI